ncbi:hypothetical protein OG2516_05403 [Oceanicola granulosus HTCC2516]|uniref:Uncharacterized protein n=1 Tax=Oceanicola granulosus (strain ATCC BAA-861 / DSM 15982 / KCTC 12143 / HTCC2516) TaxID=314256 RepID=Q2CIS1_OCEGH|nr:hypothetical protein OG2516_05403 [Oceanicola granulosus HTCC2516]
MIATDEGMIRQLDLAQVLPTALEEPA